MRILICEDEQIWRDKLSELILDKFDHDSEIVCCSKPEDVYALEHEIFDIVLMDIRLEDENGIALAAELKKRHPDWKFIFVSSYTDTYLEGIFLKIKPYGIWKKPLDERMCIDLLEMAKNDPAHKDSIVLKLYGGRTVKFQTHEILYFESDKRIVKIHLAGCCEQCYEKLDFMEKQLSVGFLRCHKSFLVNMDKIRAFEKNIIELEDGTILPVSRAKVKAVKEKYFQYIGMGL